MQIHTHPLLQSTFVRKMLGACMGALLSLTAYTAYQWGSSALSAALTSPEEEERQERWASIGRRTRELMDGRGLPASRGAGVQ